MHIKLAILSVFIAVLWDRVVPIPKFWLFEKFPILDRKPFSCMVCMSWWIGVINGIIFYFQSHNLLDSILIPILALLIVITIFRFYRYDF